MAIPPIIQIGNVLLSSDILTEKFCCDLAACKGQCCVEGDAGAPVTMEEIGEIEDRLDDVWQDLSASAQSVIDRQGVAYTDEEGDLVTSIVNGKDCVFTCYGDLEDRDTHQTIRDCCLCALERSLTPSPSPKERGVNRHGGKETNHSPLLGRGAGGEALFIKPISCALYPIRAKEFSNGTVGLNYNRWAICEPARKKGLEQNLPLYRFLRAPLIRRFGEAWYQELCDVAEELRVE